MKHANTLDLSDLTMSHHFMQNWERRVGGQPSRAFLAHIIKNSIVIQHGRLLRTRDGEPYNTLSIYWYPELSVVITIDNQTHRAVSVLSPAVKN